MNATVRSVSMAVLLSGLSPHVALSTARAADVRARCESRKDNPGHFYEADCITDLNGEQWELGRVGAKPNDDGSTTFYVWVNPNTDCESLWCAAGANGGFYTEDTPGDRIYHSSSGTDALTIVCVCR
jgi:hypothetical protein